MPPTIIFSSCRSDEPDLITRQELLLTQLKGEVLVIDHLYDLTDDSETLKRLRQTGGDWIVLARLFPRATRCILDQWGVLEGRQVDCFDWRNDFSEKESIRHLLVRSTEGDSQEEVSNLSFFTEELEPRWYPVVDRERCTNCCECINFCLFGVYSLEGDEELTVDQPNMCRPGCPACARVCPSKAIIFPECNDLEIAGKS